MQLDVVNDLKKKHLYHGKKKKSYGFILSFVVLQNKSDSRPDLEAMTDMLTLQMRI